ncbi:MAG: molybdenum cofactor guanylyltransferase [Chitinophagaceae bacterium]
MNQKTGITAVILAGGKSSRMGADKGLVIFRGRRLVEYVLDAAAGVADQILIVTSNPEYQLFGQRCVTDIYREKGPLGGIYTGLVNSTSSKNLVLGCDMPNLSIKLLKSLTAEIGNEEVLLTEHRGKPEPLCSVYDQACITPVRQRLEQDQLKITDALAGLKTRVISFDAEPWFRGNEFTNLNSPGELRDLDSSP